jgi:hypothetical protein
LDGTTIAIIVLVIVAVIVAVGFYLVNQTRQRKGLQDRFGPEYDRVVGESDKRSEAEKELRERADRVEKFHIVPLAEDHRRRYTEEWGVIQSRFVDDPGSAIGEADTLVQRVMEQRGYPITNFDQQAADLSVNHPKVVTNYRSAHEIADAYSRNESVSTERLRQALIHYRALFEDLLEAEPAHR